MRDLKYTDILKGNKALGKAMANSPSYEVKVLSNIITSQFNEIFEFFLRGEQINAKVTSGDYDNILQDSKKHSSSDTTIFFWELSNLADGLQYKADTMTSEEVDGLIEKTKNEIDFVFQQLSHAPNVIFNKFSSRVFTYSYLKENTFERIGNLLNEYVSKNKPDNFTIIDIDKVFARLSVEKCVDLRYYYSSKSLYSIEFYKEYARFVAPIVLSLLGKAKKALIFDCDNTLWHGVVGEEGIDGIGISGKDKNGGIFEEIQHLALALSKQGIIIGLCSKNNPEDIDEVFLKRGDLALKSEDILIKKINWKDKVTNLREIAAELNIGIESLVFIDDSSFEVNYIKENLNAVTTLQVPAKQYDYPSLVRDNFALFYRKNSTKEDKDRANLYRLEETRKDERERFASLDQYLSSLQLSVQLFINDESHVQRAAQLTQKTNQFNLSTRRNTESEIRKFIESGKYKIYVFSVTDKFGEYGITGMALVEIDALKATIDTFLMSCRVIGRNIEIAFLNFIIRDLQSQGVEIVLAQYVRTMKNKQVESFYDHFGFSLISGDDDTKMYSLVIRDHQYLDIDYITLKTNK